MEVVSDYGWWYSSRVDMDVGEAGYVYILSSSAHSHSSGGILAYNALESGEWTYGGLYTCPTTHYCSYGSSHGFDVELDGQGRAVSSVVLYWEAVGYVSDFGRDYVEGSLVAEAVDSETALELSQAGVPHVAFDNAEDGSIWLATQDEEVWVLEEVDANGVLGDDLALALDRQDRPHLGYYDLSREALKYAVRDGNRWWIETVDNTADVGRYVDIFVDDRGQPHLSYYDATNGDLKYAVRTKAGWQIVVLASEGDVGRHTAITLDGLDRPHVAYLDSTGLDVMHAYIPFIPTHVSFLPLSLQE